MCAIYTLRGILRTKMQVLVFLLFLVTVVMCSRGPITWPDEVEQASLTPYEQYLNEIRGDFVDNKIAKAKRCNHNCVTLYKEIDQELLSVIDVIRQRYPSPYSVITSKSDVVLCW